MSEKLAMSMPARPYLLSDLELEQMPPTAWLVEGVIPQGALVLLIGEPGVGKTFLALDLACSIGSGLPWQGHTVVAGTVVYVCAEGQAGLPERLRAWKRSRGVDRVDVRFRIEAVDVLDDGSVARLLAALRELPTAPALIVFDTYARALGGGSDSEGRHAGQAISVFDQVRALGATVLALHHPGRAEKRRGRGHSVIDASMDVGLLLERKKRSDVLVLEQVKQKDARVGEPIYLALVEVAAGEGVLSCVIAQADAPPRRAEKSAQDELTPRQRAVLAALAELPCAGARYAEWKAAANVAETSFDDSRKWLHRAGHVERALDGRRWQLSASGQALVRGTSPGTSADPETTPERGDRGAIAPLAEAATPEPRRTPKRPRTGGREGKDPEPRATPAPLIEGRGSGVVPSAEIAIDLSRIRSRGVGSVDVGSVGAAGHALARRRSARAPRSRSRT